MYVAPEGAAELPWTSVPQWSQGLEPVLQSAGKHQLE